jgi:hypothetical protein
MEIETEQSYFFIIAILVMGIMLIKLPAGFALIALSLFFLYKKLSGS